jgi:hypothetical protein
MLLVLLLLLLCLLLLLLLLLPLLPLSLHLEQCCSNGLCPITRDRIVAQV